MMALKNRSRTALRYKVSIKSIILISVEMSIWQQHKTDFHIQVKVTKKFITFWTKYLISILKTNICNLLLNRVKETISND